MNSNDKIKDSVCGFDSLYKSMRKCKKGVMWKDSVARYSNNGLASVLKLKDSLMNETYSIDKYHEFMIYEPKQREIVSTKFKDRVFQRSLCDNYIYSAITNDFIHDNGACQVDKGTDFARDRLACHLERYYRRYGNTGYVLNIDFKNYFGSTHHDIAIKSIEKRVKNEWAKQHVIDIIRSYNQGEDPDVGLGLGSQVTQLIQLAVLSDLDHYIKEELKIKFYVRYMDDLILIHPSKEYLKKCLDEIFVKIESLELNLNKKKTQIHSMNQPIKFLGFNYKLTDSGKVVMTVLKSNVKKRKRKIKAHRKLFDEGKMAKAKADECYESWKAHAKKGDSYQLIEMMDEFYEEVWKGVE